MCEKCDHIDVELARFRRMIDPVLDALTLERMRDAIKALEQGRAAIQCDSPRK